MTDGSAADDDTSLSEGYVAPIGGLLSLLFAVMAGMSLARALSGSASAFVLPIAFGIGSLLCLRLRQRALATGDEQ